MFGAGAYGGGYGGMSLFGPNLGHQNVNFNFSQGGAGMPFGFANQANQQLPPSDSQMLLEGCVVDFLLEGESLNVSKDYETIYGSKPIYYEVEKTFDNGDMEYINQIEDDNTYFIVDVDMHKEDPDSVPESFGGQHKAFIFDRKDKFAPILTIIDPKEVDKKSIDRYLYHTIYIARRYQFDHFFLRIEVSGDLEPGDPEVCLLNINRCLVSRDCWKVSITDPPEDWVNYHQHKQNGEEYQEVSVEKLDMDQA